MIDHPAPADGGPLRRWRRHGAAVSRWPQAPGGGAHWGDGPRTRGEPPAAGGRGGTAPRHGTSAGRRSDAAGPAGCRGRSPGPPAASAVAEALYDLPSHQREAIALQYYADLSELETARTIGMSIGAVHAHTARGVSALHDALETGAARVSRVAQVLTAVRALDYKVAEQILDDFALALGTRRAGSPGQHGPDLRSLMRSPAADLPLGILIPSPPSFPFIRPPASPPHTTP